MTVDGKSFATEEEFVGEKQVIYFSELKDINKYMQTKAITDNFEKNLDKEVINLMNNYSDAFEVAVNRRDFSYLAPYMYPDTDFFRGQQDYINLSAINNCL